MRFPLLSICNITLFATAVLAAPLKNTLMFPHGDNIVSQGDIMVAYGLALKPDGNLVLKASARPEETCGHTVCLQVAQAEGYP
ncbi:hypothetical protein QCA50_005782 [Cerrena zonata]|uniref:Uncharacterized protein n=1 Tax=Cerrena zonata TaxID=2478898 RepID=A0AAW0GAT8_9APHY